MIELRLEVGKSYETRTGQVYQITEELDPKLYPRLYAVGLRFINNWGMTYFPDGQYSSVNKPSDSDLVKEAV